jgi:type IV pilus assembly protein PilB
MGNGFFGSFFKRNAEGEPDSSRPAPIPPDAAASQKVRSALSSEDGRESIFPEDAETLAREFASGLDMESIDMLSPIDTLMQDPVIVDLLKEEVVDVSLALIALKQHQQQPGSVLWRVLAGQPGVQQDKIIAVAARVHGHQPADITEKRPPRELIEAVVGLFPEKIGQEMLRLGLLPYEFKVDPKTRKHQLTLVHCDPLREDVARFVKRIPLEVELRYAAEADIRARINGFEMPVAVAQPAEAEARAMVPAAPALDAYSAAEPAEVEVKDSGRPVKGRGLDLASVLYPEPAPPEELRQNVHSDIKPDDGFLPKDEIEPVRTEEVSGDGFLDFQEPEVQIGSHDDSPKAQLDEEPFLLNQEPDAVASIPSDEESEVNAAPPEAESPGSNKKSGSGGVDAANLEAIKSKDRVVAMLLRKEIVTPKQVQDAEQQQKSQKSKESLWRVLTQVAGVDREAVFAEAARVYAFPIAKIGEGKPDPEFARSVIDTFSEEKRSELFKLRVLPFECDLEHQTGAIKLVFVTHDPTRPEVNRLMQQLKLERFELRYAPEAVVISAMHEAYPRRNEFLERMNDDSVAFDLGTSYDEKAGLVDEDALEAEINRSSLINLFEATLVEAVRQGASDVHIYPNAHKKIEIHFRIDGRLNHWHTEDKVHPEALLAVIKDNATNVDRFERDAAQDGFIQRWIDDALIRFRVSVLPIANASAEIRSESIVIRVLDDRKVVTDLKKLGLLGNALERFDSAIRQPHGMVILTGPTGSGKSTTLVAALHQVVTPEVNVLTVEDPVEYIIPGVRQIKLNHKLGLEEALRSILRHDPDVVMVGEMRDRQTAELAIKLANTGHLTFSTLHTNDAPAAVSRLYKMGIEPFLIAYAINLVVAQRLIRTLCPECKKPDDDPDPVMMKKLGFTDEEIANTKIYLPGTNQNCKTCKGTGYKGRRAVTEALYFSRAIRHLIVESTKMIDEDAIRDQAKKEGMLTLADSAREVVKMGDTSMMEMVRVVTTES